MRLFSRHFLPKGLYTVWFINRGIAAPFFKQEGKMRGEIDLYMKRQRQEGADGIAMSNWENPCKLLIVEILKWSFYPNTG